MNYCLGIRSANLRFIFGNFVIFVPIAVLYDYLKILLHCSSDFSQKWFWSLRRHLATSRNIFHWHDCEAATGSWWVGRGQGCCLPSHSAQDYIAKDSLAQNVNSARVEKPCIVHLWKWIKNGKIGLSDSFQGCGIKRNLY